MLNFAITISQLGACTLECEWKGDQPRTRSKSLEGPLVATNFFSSEWTLLELIETDVVMP